ncbi:endonuclease I family protein [Photobacterium satsumensis]|uniref:endonuclease I family protein n=1 Tax=Photobacterium satsumensis TaxID=2910239 RepID=UPI003D0D7A54
MKLKALALATFFATSVNAAYVQSHDPHIVAPFSLECTVSVPDKIITEQSTALPDGYYANAKGKTGDELKAALNTIITAGHKRLSYKQVWTALEITDQDPYDPNNVILLYSGKSIPKNEKSGRPQGQKNDRWNREHVYPKSNGGFPKESWWAYTDIHHLRPADESMNSERGNKEFDNGGQATEDSPFAGNKLTATTFEPRDEVKGDVARMIFYMAVRYEGHDEGHSKLTPNLELSTATVNNGTDFGNVCAMLEWNKEDPVDEFESLRNDRIYKLQGNRNPFIDKSEWADELFGHNC